MQRILFQNTRLTDTLKISDVDLYHQLTRVLRARIGQQVIFFDGKILQDIVYTIISIDKKYIELEKKEVLEKKSENIISLTLYQALPNKLSKLEYIVQKCSEIGYKEIIFFESERSQKLILSEAKKERLRKISIEATEQCGGNIIPEIEFVLSSQDTSFQLSPAKREKGELQFCLSGQERIKRGVSGETSMKNTNTLNIFCHTVSDIKAKKLSELESHIGDTINILVGPEGGFSPQEVEKFYSIGFQNISLGRRILRSETVGEVVGFYLVQ